MEFLTVLQQKFRFNKIKSKQDEFEKTQSIRLRHFHFTSAGFFQKNTLKHFFETAVKMVSVISVQQSLLTCQTGHKLILCLQTNFPQ